MDGQIKAKNEEREGLIEATVFVLSVLKETQEKIKVSLDTIVNNAIDSLFSGQGYRFEFQFDTKRNQTEITPVLYKGEYRLGPIMGSDGGGLSQCISFGIRVAFLCLSRNDKILILDEPGKDLSKEYRGLFCELLKGITTLLGVQLIIITHMEEIEAIADRVFFVDQKVDGEFKKSFVEVKR